MHLTGKVDVCGVHSLKFGPPVSPRFRGQVRVSEVLLNSIAVLHT